MSWDVLAPYRVAYAHVPLAPVGWTLFGSALHGINMLAVGFDANGLVLQKSALLGAAETF